jgi:hypothetical protein
VHAGNSWAADRLTGKLIALNHAEEALNVLRAWDDADDSWAHHIIDHLGMLIALDHTEEALDVLRARADVGGRDVTYRNKLADLLAQQDHLDELRDRAGNGDETAANRLVDRLADRGDLDELRDRADAGDQHAVWRLGKLGYLDQLRARADAGDDAAAAMLAHLLADLGDLDELRDRADAGDFRAAQYLTGLLRQEGRLEDLWDEVDAGTDGPARSHVRGPAGSPRPSHQAHVPGRLVTSWENSWVGASWRPCGGGRSAVHVSKPKRSS